MSKTILKHIPSLKDSGILIGAVGLIFAFGMQAAELHHFSDKLSSLEEQVKMASNKQDYQAENIAFLKEDSRNNAEQMSRLWSKFDEFISSRWH